MTDNGAAANAARELAELNRQVEETRANLIRLRLEVTKTQRRVSSTPQDRLIESNQMLVVSALRALTDAETAQGKLNEVSRAAQLDPLTKLPNRALLLDRLEHAIATSKRHRGRLALLFLDLDGFKQINDALGHAVGDEALKLVAHRLTSSVREADTVSRHGGDEFLILVTDVRNASDAVLVAAKVSAALGALSFVGEHELHLKASIGISIYPDDGEDAASLIDRADAAMYRAKKDGPGSFAFHHDKSVNTPSLEPAALKLLGQPMNGYATELLEHEQRYALMREANERLLLTAIKAQELLALAQQGQQK